MVKNVESKKCEMRHNVECTVSKYLKLIFFEEKKTTDSIRNPRLTMVQNVLGGDFLHTEPEGK
jgi:hypothetical protein